MKKIILPLLLLGFLSACGTGYMTANVSTDYPEGNELYKSKCAGCHKLYDRDEYTITEWDSLLIPMQAKSKITDDERENILMFLKETDKKNNK